MGLSRKGETKETVGISFIEEFQLKKKDVTTYQRKSKLDFYPIRFLHTN